MNSYTNDSFYENMSHQTDAAPYSVHYTEAAVDHEPVLYLHWHHEMEFLVLVQGEITVHMEDRSYVLMGFLFRLGCFITPIVGQKSRRRFMLLFYRRCSCSQSLKRTVITPMYCRCCIIIWLSRRF